MNKIELRRRCSKDFLPVVLIVGLAIVLGTVVVLLFHFVVVEDAYAQEGELSTSTILRYNEGNITGGTITKIVDGDTLDLGCGCI